MTSDHWFYLFAFFGLIGVPAVGLFLLMGKLGPEVRQEADRRSSDHLVTRR